MSALSDALNEANTEGWPAREIARRGGDRVSHSQINKYLKPVHPRPTEKVLKVFADVLGIPLPRLRELAGLPVGSDEPYVPPTEANRLGPHARDVVDELIRMLARAETPPVERAADKDERRARTEPTVAQVRAAQDAHLRAVADAGDQDDAAEVERIAREERREQTGEEL